MGGITRGQGRWWRPGPLGGWVPGRGLGPGGPAGDRDRAEAAIRGVAGLRSRGGEPGPGWDGRGAGFRAAGGDGVWSGRASSASPECGPSGPDFLRLTCVGYLSRLDSIPPSAAVLKCIDIVPTAAGILAIVPSRPERTASLPIQWYGSQDAGCAAVRLCGCAAVRLCGCARLCGGGSPSPPERMISAPLGDDG